MNRRFTACALAALVIRVSSFVGSSALADTKAFAASLCKVTFGVAFVSTRGAIVNNSSANPSNIVCPLVRDHPLQSRPE